MSQLLLASKSPRRRELLQLLGLPHSIISVDCDESYPAGLSPEETVRYVSRKKADAARSQAQGEDLILTADTMVFLDDRRFGKPADEDDAFSMLRALSGREHLVCTGVTLLRGEDCLTEAEATKVRFAPLSDDLIRAYIRTGEPMDKAGAYGIQGKGSLLVEGVSGDFFNVIGLPVHRLSCMLEHFGIRCLH